MGQHKKFTHENYTHDFADVKIFCWRQDFFH